MSRHIEPIDPQRMQSRIRGRRAAAEVLELLDACEQEDRDFMSSCIESLTKLAGLEERQPEPETHEPIARLCLTRMPFGEYEGRTFDETPLDYLDWLCREQEEFYRGLRAYLRHPKLEEHRGEYDDGISDAEAAEELERHIREG